MNCGFRVRKDIENDRLWIFLFYYMDRKKAGVNQKQMPEHVQPEGKES
jgi:hypothetical protein